MTPWRNSKGSKGEDCKIPVHNGFKLEGGSGNPNNFSKSIGSLCSNAEIIAARVTY